MFPGALKFVPRMPTSHGKAGGSCHSEDEMSRIVEEAVVEIGGRIRVQPAGLFRYQVTLCDESLHYTLWCQFGRTAAGDRGVLFYIEAPPKWDDGRELDAEEACELFGALEAAFGLKGYRVFTSILRPGSGPGAEVSELMAIAETKLGELLDEVSALHELSDVCREYLFSESKKEFRKLCSH